MVQDFWNIFEHVQVGCSIVLVTEHTTSRWFCNGRQPTVMVHPGGRNRIYPLGSGVQNIPGTLFSSQMCHIVISTPGETVLFVVTRLFSDSSFTFLFDSEIQTKTKQNTSWIIVSNMSLFIPRWWRQHVFIITNVWGNSSLNIMNRCGTGKWINIGHYTLTNMCWQKYVYIFPGSWVMTCLVSMMNELDGKYWKHSRNSKYYRFCWKWSENRKM